MKSLESRYSPLPQSLAPPSELEIFPAETPNDEPLPLLVSLVIPSYNEGSILKENLEKIEQYTLQENCKYSWEFVIVNDGSADNTGAIAVEFSKNKSNVVVVHHPCNLGLGQALKSGFSYSEGDYIITLDVDLSYAPYHIEILLEKIIETQSQIVVASPYMEGGQVSNVPYLRKELSVWANRFLAVTAKRSLCTFTGMVRIYEGRFLKGLNLKATGMDINPEIIHKAQLLGARIEEVPAHLNWSTERLDSIQRRPRKSKGRVSSMKILRHTWAILFYGFIFRPVMFFILPSLILFLLSLYANVWVIIHCWFNYQALARVTPYPDPTVAVAQAFQQAPHAFVIGGMTLMLSIQLFSLGILAVQSKSYFEEIFYLASAIYRQNGKTGPRKD